MSHRTKKYATKADSRGATSHAVPTFDTATKPIAAAPPTTHLSPITAPTIDCVVDTGLPSSGAKWSQEEAASKQSVIPAASSKAFSSKISRSMMPPP